MFRQKVPESSRFFYTQFLRDAAPRGIMGRLFDLKPDFINPQLGLLAIAAESAIETDDKGETGLRSKDARIYQPKGKGRVFDLDEMMSAHMTEMPMRVSRGARSRKITYQKNNCRIWSEGGENATEANHILLADQPFLWSWALLLVENGRINVHFAEKLRIVDAAKGSLQFSGSVITIGFEGIQITDLAEAELPKESLLFDFDEKHDLVRLQRYERAEMMAEIQKSAP